MAISILISGEVTLDESDGLQTGVAGTATEDNNDSDVSLATLLAAVPTFHTRLFGAGELALSTLFATANGVARSASNYISLSGTGTITSLGFTTDTGAVLPVYGVASDGADCNLTTVDGHAIELYSDSASELGTRVVLGVDDVDGSIVFAMFMEVAADLKSARVWMVEFEAISNPDDADHDDPLELTGLGVGAGVSSEFNFNGLPSGQNLFGMVGSTGSALIVIGKTTALNADHTYTNASNTINTSQGGGNTTIGVNNQMFDANDGAYFTYVRGANSNFLGSNLDANEADDADNMLYTDGDAGTNDTIEVDSAFLKIAQTQGGGTQSLHIDTYNIAGSPQGTALIAASGQNQVAVTRVVVYNSAGAELADSDDGNSNGITFNLTGLGATVGGLAAGYKIEWFTDGLHDQVLVTGVSGKFDIGGFGINEPSSEFAPLTDLRFEDDGPTVALALDSDAELLVDESSLAPPTPVAPTDTITIADLLSTNSADFGTDGEGTNSSVYKLLLGAANSGLLDTATGDPVLLTINLAGTLITGAVNGGADVVFTIELDTVTEELTLTQYRAMVNGDPTDPVESDSPLTLAANTVKIERTVTDGDDDSANANVDISAIFKFEDDGPALPGATQAPLELITDDTDLTPDTATLSTDDIFPSVSINVYGADGPSEDDPIVYSLRVVGTDPASGLIDTATNRAILLKKEAGGDVVGIVDSNGNGSIDLTETTVAIRFALSVPVPGDLDTELVTFTQYRAVVHDDVSDDDEDTSPETINGGLVFIDQQAIDGDDDVSNTVSFDLGAITQIRDDGPDIGPIANSIVDFVLNDSANEDLNGAVGKDPNSTPYKLTSYTSSLTVNGVELHGVLSLNDTRVTYYADSDNSGTYGDGTDVAYYRLDLGDQVGEGDYTFTVLVNPPPAFTEFDFTYLPSGQNLFGTLVDQDSNGIQELDGLGLLVVGRDAVLGSDGTYTNASNTINTSKGGGAVTIGVNNQMFDQGEGAIFVYVDNPDDKSIAINSETGSGGLTQTTADDADTVGFQSTAPALGGEIEVVQKQGGGALGMKISAYDVVLPQLNPPNNGEQIVSAADPGTGTSTESRQFMDNPLQGATAVGITTIKVWDRADPSNVLESVTLVGGVAVNNDGDGDGLVDNAAGISVVFTQIGATGKYTATVTGFTANDTIAWTTDGNHDAVLIEGTSGKWDVGGFNLAQGNDLPDQKLDFTARVTDGDGDYDEASWSVGIDGTGVNHDGQVSGVDIV